MCKTNFLLDLRIFQEKRRLLFYSPRHWDDRRILQQMGLTDLIDMKQNQIVLLRIHQQSAEPFH